MDVTSLRLELVKLTFVASRPAGDAVKNARELEAFCLEPAPPAKVEEVTPIVTTVTSKRGGNAKAVDNSLDDMLR